MSNSRQRYLRTHTLSSRLSCLTLNTLFLVISISQHFSPQISLPTRLGSPRTTSAVVVCRLRDGGVGLSTLALLDRTFVYEFHIPSYVYCLFFLSEHSLASPSTLEPFLFDLVPTVLPLNIEHRRVGLSLARLTPFYFTFSPVSYSLIRSVLVPNCVSPNV